MRSRRVPATVSALLLAAGRSTRFGGPKLLAPLGGVPLVRVTAERVLAAAVSELVVVVAQGDHAVRAALAGLDAGRARVVVNPHAAAGMSTSLVAGLDALDTARVGAVLVALADQPTISPAVIDRVIAEWRRGDAAIVVPIYGGERGHPVLFDARLVSELRAVRGDQGARAVIERDDGRVVRIALPVPAPADVDTRDDYRRLTGEA